MLARQPGRIGLGRQYQGRASYIPHNLINPLRVYRDIDRAIDMEGPAVITPALRFSHSHGIPAVSVKANQPFSCDAHEYWLSVSCGQDVM